MSKRKRNNENRATRRFGTLLLIIGLLLIAAAIGLVLYNIWDSDRAGKASNAILEEIDEEQEGMEVENAPTPSVNRDQEVDERVRDTGLSYLQQKEMPTILVDGYRYIGTLEIPSLGLRLPVMDSWDYTRLKISPCLYSGSYFTDDMVICAHNYARHFSPIKGVAIGADVYFITADKVIYHYTVSNRETVQPTSVEQMIQNMNNTSLSGGEIENWDLTLFTCNTGGQTRCAVRCIRKS